MSYDRDMCILLVDGSQDRRGHVRNMLRRKGFTNLIESKCVVTAFEVLNSKKIDCIISARNSMDGYGRPTLMIGIELLCKVRASEEFTDTPFLMLVGETNSEEKIIEAVQAKVTSCIITPFSDEALMEKIDEMFS